MVLIREEKSSGTLPMTSLPQERRSSIEVEAERQLRYRTNACESEDGLDAEDVHHDDINENEEKESDDSDEDFGGDEI